MRWCKACRLLSPHGAAFCGGCAGAFGGTKCLKCGHLTPGRGGLSVCPVCRSADIVQPVPSVGLGCLPRMFAWGVALLAVRLALAHLGEIFGLAWRALGLVGGSGIIGRFGSLLSLALTLKVFLWCVGFFNPDLAKRADPFPKFVPTLWKVAAKILSLVGKGLVRAVEGGSPEKSKKRKDRSPEGK